MLNYAFTLLSLHTYSTSLGEAFVCNWSSEQPCDAPMIVQRYSEVNIVCDAQKMSKNIYNLLQGKIFSWNNLKLKHLRRSQCLTRCICTDISADYLQTEYKNSLFAVLCEKTEDLFPECLVSKQPPSMRHMLLILDVSPCCPPLSARYQGGEGCHEYPASPCHPACHQQKVNVTSVSKRVTYISLSGLIDRSHRHHMPASSVSHIFFCSNLVCAGKMLQFLFLILNIYYIFQICFYFLPQA